MPLSAVAEEHQARLKAEAEAENATRRLAVAQEQIAEYALQREGEAGHLLGQVQAVHAKLASALPQDGNAGSSLNDLGAQVQARSSNFFPDSLASGIIACQTGHFVEI